MAITRSDELGAHEVSDALKALGRDVASLAQALTNVARGGVRFAAALAATRLVALSMSRAKQVSPEDAPPPQPPAPASDTEGFGPAPGGYGPAAAPGTAVGGDGLFGPDVSRENKA
jgi:hypothetical protein